MAKDKANETATATATEPTNENLFDVTAPELSEKDLTARADAKRRLREQKMKAIAFMEIPYIQSKKLLGVEFDIVDAVRKTIDGEINVAFILSLKNPVEDFLAGARVSVSKKLNAYTEAYLDYFESFDSDETPEPMEAYTFVEISGGQAGNKPIVLRKL